MQQMTFHIPDEVVEHVESEASDRDISKSKVVRELLQRGMDYDQLESTNSELRSKLEASNRDNKIDDKLVRYVEHDIDFHEAGIATKLRWYIFGKD